MSDTLTFEEGLNRINAAIQRTKIDDKSEIITSSDERVKEAQSQLEENVLPSFRKWQLPVYLERASQLFITVAPPNAKVPSHSHNEGDGIRFIVTGSVRYKDKELTSGNWMYIPAGKEYDLEIGPFGAMMCYCYCCSCVPRIQ